MATPLTSEGLQCAECSCQYDRARRIVTSTREVEHEHPHQYERKTYSGGNGAREGADEHSSCGSQEWEMKFHFDVDVYLMSDQNYERHTKVSRKSEAV